MKRFFENNLKIITVLSLALFLVACSPKKDEELDTDTPVAEVTATKEVEKPTPTEMEEDSDLEDSKLTPTIMDEELEEDEDSDVVDKEEKNDEVESNSKSGRTEGENWAKIDSVKVEIEENNILVIANGTHMNSCSLIDKYNWSRNGNVVEIDLALKEVDPEKVCAQSTRSFTQNINVDPSTFKPGEYTADVNGVTTKFEIE